MICTTSATNRHSLSSRIGEAALRAIAAQMLLLCSVVGLPVLFCHAVEFEKPVESCSVEYEAVYGRCCHTRNRTVSDVDRFRFQQRLILDSPSGNSGSRTMRASAPRWLRSDLAAPLLC